LTLPGEIDEEPEKIRFDLYGTAELPPHGSLPAAAARACGLAR